LTDADADADADTVADADAVPDAVPVAVPVAVADPVAVGPRPMPLTHADEAFRRSSDRDRNFLSPEASGASSSACA